MELIGFREYCETLLKKQNKVIGSPFAKPWTKKDYITYVEILEKKIEKLENQLKKK